MKKLFTLFILTTIFSPAKAVSIQETVQQQVRHMNLVNEQPELAPWQIQAVQALQQELDKPLRTISWEQFQQENTQLQQEEKIRMENLSGFREALFEEDRELFTKECAPYQWHEGRPDYTRETKGIKYIYVGETHNKTTFIQEMISLLEQIRKANPQARILVATEFAVSGRGKQPLAFAKSIREHDDLPIYIASGHIKWFVTAGNLDIDVLALDDYFNDYTNGQVKMGNALVTIPPDNPQISSILQEYVGSNYAEHRAMYYFLARSDWGIQQRNTQWVRYINALESFYDIIIVYAGNGHLSSGEARLGLPDLIKSDSFVNFMFYTDEQIPSELAHSYKQSSNVQKKQGTLLQLSLMSDAQRAYLSSLPRPTYDKGTAFFKVHTPNLATQKNLQLLNKLSQQYLHANFKPRQGKRFDIFLPDRSKDLF